MCLKMTLQYFRTIFKVSSNYTQAKTINYFKAHLTIKVYPIDCNNIDTKTCSDLPRDRPAQDRPHHQSFETQKTLRSIFSSANFSPKNIWKSQGECNIFDLICDLIKSICDLIESICDLIESIYDLIESICDLIESICDLIESIYDLIESICDLIESICDLIQSKLCRV